MPWLLAFIETTGLNWLWGKISGLIVNYLAQRKATAEIEKQNKLDREALQNAKTKEELDEAAKNLINHF